MTAVHRWEPRTKLVSLMALVFGMAGVQDVRWLPLLLLVSLGLYHYAGLAWRHWWQRLRLPGGLLLLGVLSVPFWLGPTPLLTTLPIPIYAEGTIALLLIVGRFVAIMTVAMVAVGTLPLTTLIQALRSLGLPALLIDMAILSYRYSDALGQQLRTLQIALRLRGMQRPTFKTLAALIGTVLVRSYLKSEQIYTAMQLRGYGSAQPPLSFSPPSRRDRLGCAACLSLCILWVSV